MTPIQKGTKETRQQQRYGDVMRLHEAAPKLIIQERLGDKVKVSSYWPVPELTRAELALGRLQIFSIGPYIADYPEQVWLTAIISDWCPT